MSFEPIWGAPIAWYLFPCRFGRRRVRDVGVPALASPEAANMRKAGHIIAPVVVMIGLVLLMVDAEAGLHNPLRFALLLHNPFSVMTWGVVFLAAFMVIALVVLLLDFLKKRVPHGWKSRASYSRCASPCTRALCWACARRSPVERRCCPFCPGVRHVGGRGVGSAGGRATFRRRVRGRGSAEEGALLPALIEIVLVAALCFITSYNSTAGFDSVMGLVCGSWAPLFWLGLVVVGLVAPTAVERLGCSSSLRRSSRSLPRLA